MLLIERLDTARHERTAFDCGVPGLNVFLQQYAGQFGERNLGVTWVAVQAEDSTRILGYYTLSGGALIPDELPHARIALPQVPIILLGRLAVERTAQGRGYGRRLLLHALHHALYFSSLVGVYAVVVDAIDESALRFYQRFGFAPLQGNPFRLHLSMRDIAKLPLLPPSQLPPSPRVQI